MIDSSDNINLLFGKDARFEIDRLPMVSYFLSSITIPSISANAIRYGTPFTDLKIHTDRIQFSPLLVTFKVDEDLRNYEEIFSWINTYATPDNFPTYKGENQSATTKTAYTNQSSFATGYLSTNKDNPNIQFKFENLFPTELSDIQIDITEANPRPITCTATFEYTKFTIERSG